LGAVTGGDVTTFVEHGNFKTPVLGQRSMLSKDHAPTAGLVVSLVATAVMSFVAGCAPPKSVDENSETVRSEAEARKIVTDNVRLIAPYDIEIAPGSATLTPCGNFDENAIGEGPPWSVSASRLLSGPEEIAAAVRRVDTLVESGYRRLPSGPLPTYPEERVYEDDRGYSIGVSATKLPSRVEFDVFSASPCTIDLP
jgi:hypothetical protein